MQGYFSEFDIDLREVRKHYKVRSRISKKLKSLLKNRDFLEYAELAVGVSDVSGNFSAAEHDLGPIIISSNKTESIIGLASKLSNKDIDPTGVVKSIYCSSLSYLKIGVGSEMACMLQPKQFWVGMHGRFGVIW